MVTGRLSGRRIPGNGFSPIGATSRPKHLPLLPAEEILSDSCAVRQELPLDCSRAGERPRLSSANFHVLSPCTAGILGNQMNLLSDLRKVVHGSSLGNGDPSPA